ncbi:MAG TPA: LytTR family DNA-binding domain-containing protein [Moheibacter sp.]|nr:LytTR family DNA-binding domain-containing protein [Moheibacter sp.]
MNIAIIDDEVHCIESLVIHMNELFPKANVVYKTNKVQESVEKLKELPIDLLFLDIEMPGMTGFQLLEHFSERKFDVIFTTAYSEYAIKAFKAKAISYLLKPIDEEELKETIENWAQEKNKNHANEQNIDELIDQLKKEGFMKSKISVPISDGYEFVEVNDILYCNSQSNYTNLHLVNGSKILVSKTLKEVENALRNFFFIRVHQSYLINPNYMKKFSRNDGGYILMQNQESIPVSNAKKSLIVNLFDSVRKD